VRRGLPSPVGVKCREMKIVGNCRTIADGFFCTGCTVINKRKELNLRNLIAKKIHFITISLLSSYSRKRRNVWRFKFDRDFWRSLYIDGSQRKTHAVNEMCRSRRRKCSYIYEDFLRFLLSSFISARTNDKKNFKKVKVAHSRLPSVGFRS